MNAGPTFAVFFSVHCNARFAALSRSAAISFGLGPIRDLFSFVVFAIFFGRRLERRGQYYGVVADKPLAYYE